MYSFEILILILIAIYVIIFSLLTYGFISENENYKTETLTPITVIIPFRNEEANIINLVNSLKNLNYNLNIVEFIFINDHSTDNGYTILSQELKKTSLIYKIIQQADNKNGKKLALETGIRNTKNEFIVTLDADSTPSKKWLKEYANAFQNGNQFIIGPVINKSSDLFIAKLHSVEAIMLSAISMGSASLHNPLICSGANLGYTKSLFTELNPYKSNKNIASGDDIFFLDAVLEAKHKVNYLRSKDALVYTKSHNNYTSLLSQAIRWSSKNSQLKNKKNFYLSALVFIVNLLIIPNLILAINGNSISLLFLLFKFTIDTILFISSAKLYKQLNLLFYTPFIYFFYPIHLLIIFVSSIFVSTQWKGRSIINNGKKE